MKQKAQGEWLPYCPTCGGEAESLPIHPGWWGCLECKCQWEEAKRLPKWPTVEENDQWRKLGEELIAQANDAERYRYLRENFDGFDAGYGEPPRYVLAFRFPSDIRIGLGDRFDAAIDKARAEIERADNAKASEDRP